MSQSSGLWIVVFQEIQPTAAVQNFPNVTIEQNIPSNCSELKQK